MYENFQGKHTFNKGLENNHFFFFFHSGSNISERIQICQSCKTDSLWYWLIDLQMQKLNGIIVKFDAGISGKP